MAAKRRPYVIGITGGIASGKSAAADYLSTLGAVNIDADGISRELTQPGGTALPPIRERFGDGVFFSDGALNRRALGQIVFSDAAARRALEGILHPMVQARMLGEAEAARPEDIVLFNVPLLYETGMDALCDETWLMTLPREEQIRRVTQRDNLTREEAVARVESQMPDEEKLARSDVAVRSDRPVEQTQQELSRLFAERVKLVAKLCAAKE